jgi:adenosine deaminase
MLFFVGCSLDQLEHRVQDDKLHRFVEQMPKVELHVHLEGSIRPETLMILADRNNITLPFKRAEEAHDFFVFKDFQHFKQVYELITRCLKTPDDYELIAYEFGKDRARQNIRYSEVTFSLISNCQSTGLTWQQILDALNKGRLRAQQEFGVQWAWVLDVLREQVAQQSLILNAAMMSSAFGVVALGLSGAENARVVRRFKYMFKKAHAMGLGIVPHAGETMGAESVWGVIKNIPTDRIGHGVRSIEDPALVVYLKHRQIPLELCPTSNLCIGVYKSFKEHPLRQLWDAGVYVTVNSDDPTLFNTDLNNEYKILVDHFGFGIKDLEAISLRAVQASFLSADQKKKMIGDFELAYKKAREDLNL